jgi:hypothetical protein
MSQLICDRSIMGLAVAQQFYSGARRSRASDNRVTRSPNDCSVVVRRIGAGNQTAHPDPCSLRSNPEKVWRFWRRCAGPRRG